MVQAVAAQPSVAPKWWEHTDFRAQLASDTKSDIKHATYDYAQRLFDTLIGPLLVPVR